MKKEEKKKIEELSFEEAYSRLEKIVGELEKGDAPLDSLLALYEEGTALLRRANALLSEAEQRVLTVGDEEAKED